uniref:Uncharacterized protein n=1 Tax=Eptatretus burgeri TaxID=7764 RepID=A0A8C4QN63_EPTBU
MCAALSAYTHACAAYGLILNGWRKNLCDVGLSPCPTGQVFRYDIKACNTSCRSLSSPDPTCFVQDTPVEGCACPLNSFRAEDGTCLEGPSTCPCYLKQQTLQPGQSIQRGSDICLCRRGVLNCRNPTIEQGEAYLITKFTLSHAISFLIVVIIIAIFILILVLCKGNALIFASLSPLS